MNVVLVADIRNHSQAHLWQHPARQQLRLAQLRPVAVDGRGGDLVNVALLVSIPRRELHREKGKIALAPVVAPVANHVGKQPAILPGPARIRFALIPDRAFDGVGRQRRDHAVVKLGRLPERR